MKRKFTSLAERDVIEVIAYYEKQRPGLGGDFLVEVEAALERITDFPHAWQKISRTARRCRLTSFPYGVIYRANRDGIIIVAVAHLHTEPNQWLKR